MKHLKALCLLSSLLLATACTVNGEPVQPEKTSTTQQKVSAASKEESFIQAFGEVVGKTSETIAPTDPSTTGFALLPLDKALYGTEVYAFLPMGQRALTGEEMLQLATAFPGLTGEEILDSQHVYVYPRDGAHQNRSLTRTEFIDKLWMDNEYRYMGARPSKAAGSPLSPGDPIDIQLGEALFWILPQGALTEEQLLQMIRREYESVPEEALAPRSDELSYQEVPQQAKVQAAQGGLSLSEACEAYASYRSDGRWVVWLHDPGLAAEEGHTDYELILHAKTGSLEEWSLLPYGIFDPEAVLADMDIQGGADIQRGDQAYIDGATAYIQSLMPGVQFTQPGISRRDVETPFGFAMEVSLPVQSDEGQGRYHVILLKEDLNVYRVVFS